MKDNTKRFFVLFADFFVIFLLTGLDQYTKLWAVQHLKDQPPMALLEGVFELKYLENRGAAFGMLQDQKAFFILIACIILAAICYVLFKIPLKKKYSLLHLLLMLIASGAIGNMIDRIRLDYVVDFFYFALINFPIFNMADIYVSVACFLLALAILFVYRDEDLEFLSIRKKRIREIK